MSWFLAFAGFAALIVLHEFGHFIAAKACGMRVERFFLFFPPKLVSVRRGETEYGIGAIPLGGFVKITGMNPEEEVAVDEPGGGERTIPATEYSRSYYSQPVWKRIVTIAAGPAVNVLIAFAILFALGFGLEEPRSLAVGEVQDGTPAASALEEGDRILLVNGVPARNGDVGEQVDRVIASFEGFSCVGAETDRCPATNEATVVVERDGQRETFELRPFYDAAEGRFRLGFGFEGTDLVPVDSSPGQSAEFAADRMWFVTTRTLEVIGNLVDAERRRELSGVVGGYEVTRQSFEFDTRQALGVLALISLSLALINLFPFLPLDGGHIFWSVVEKVRGRRVPFRVMERASVIGFALVLMLFVIGLSNDIGRLTGEGFDVR
ncbi:MAG TPA: M50 family metallopeptidase [Solirubrobacterales bacterium]|nr:M50 family metallopeptidase [Solirubrobacterales bacterium]